MVLYIDVNVNSTIGMKANMSEVSRMARILLFGGRNSNIRKSINSTGGNMIYVYNRGAIFGITVGKVPHTDCITVSYAHDVAWDLSHDNGIGGICIFYVNIIDLFRTDDNPMLGKNSR